MLNVGIKTEILIIQAAGEEVGVRCFVFCWREGGRHGLRWLGTKKPTVLMALQIIPVNIVLHS